MKNFVKWNKRITILMVIILIFMLSGCSGNGKVDKNPNSNVSSETQTVDANNTADDTPQTTNQTDQDTTSDQDTEQNIDGGNTTTPVDQTKEEGNADTTKDDSADVIEKIRPVDGPKPLDISTPHDPIPEMYVKSGSLSPLAPYYGNGWRAQLVEMKGNHAVLDIGNTGSEPIVISNDNAYYILFDRGGTNIADSNVVGGSVTILPNEIKRVTIEAGNPQAIVLHLSVNGEEREFAYQKKGESFNDAEPYSAPMNDDTRRASSKPEVLRVYDLGVVSGNGKLKYVAESVQMISNEHIGSFSIPENLKSEDSSIVLLKIKIANTSDEVLKLSSIYEKYAHGRDVGDLPITDNALKALGENALPTSIQPRTVVEGYVPVAFFETGDLHTLFIESNQGTFMVSNVQRLPLR